MGWWIGGLVGWWSGLVDGLDWWVGVDWWIGGLVEWKLAAWGSEVLQVTSNTRDRDGSADYYFHSHCYDCDYGDDEDYF